MICSLFDFAVAVVYSAASWYADAAVVVVAYSYSYSYLYYYCNNHCQGPTHGRKKTHRVVLAKNSVVLSKRLP